MVVFRRHLTRIAKRNISSTYSLRCGWGAVCPWCTHYTAAPMIIYFILAMWMIIICRVADVYLYTIYVYAYVYVNRTEYTSGQTYSFVVYAYARSQQTAHPGIRRNSVESSVLRFHFWEVSRKAESASFLASLFSLKTRGGMKWLRAIRSFS
jgi:hypothetical protein